MGEQPVKNERLRSLPSIDELLGEPSLAALLAGTPRQLVVGALRAAVSDARERLLSGSPRGFETADVVRALARVKQSGLQRVLNATGVVLHTNLGRAPLARAAVQHLTNVASGYSNLELDLESGERGSRYSPIVESLRVLTGAEDALVVNNCAAAVLLALTALGQGRRCVVSRGELVEIGGGFRMPDVMRQAGVTLVEVGTTNRTRRSDYEEACSPEVALLLKVHRSNFAQVGFTQEASVAELASLAREHGIPLVVDMGSGNLVPLRGDGLTPEETMASVVRAGAHLVAFSGDKLLGGPQAGILVGKADVIARLQKHPLTRALRIDKLCVAALEATLTLYREGREDEIPARRLLTESSASLRGRADGLARLLTEQGVDAQVVETEGQVGGGTMPLAAPPSFACALGAGSADWAAALRSGRTPVIARVSNGELLLDIRCLADDELEVVSESVKAASRENAC